MHKRESAAFELSLSSAAMAVGGMAIDAPAIVIDGIAIGQDSEGRYRLNDLKLVAEAKNLSSSRHTHAIATYFRRKSTKLLIEEIVNQDTAQVAPTVTTEGWGGGTYACKELVLDYAWNFGQAFYEAVQLAFKEARQITQFNSTTQGQKNMTSTQNTNGLIPVFTGMMQGQAVQLCNARDLHAYLQVGKDFSTWMKERIETYGFIEGKEFLLILGKTSKGSKGGRPITEYHLTLDTAKEIAMVEKSEQGRMACRYFSELIQTSLEGKTMSHEPEKAQHNQVVVIGETTIQQDANGRYYLNDLHRAAGGQPKHKPSEWLRNQQTKELIAEITNAGIPAIQSKQQLGTFVCRELVYLYAMWISPKFNLAVIRAFDALVTGRQQQPQIENKLPYDIEKACDFRSWKLSNEYHQHTMQLIGTAARPNDEQVMSESAFLIKRRLYDQLVALAKSQLDKKSPHGFITDLLLSWQPQSQLRSR